MPKDLESKIFGIGLSKTGTTSLYVALHDLGYRSATFRHLKELGLEDWRRGDFTRDYLLDYDAATDLPIGIYFPELDRRYPGSKFVLTTRDIESWLASCKTQFGRSRKLDDFNRETLIAAYGIDGFNEKLYRHAYWSHYHGVEQYFRDRPGDLLVLDIAGGEGWDRLCPFLGVDIPQIPFPRAKPGYVPPGNRGRVRTSGHPKNDIDDKAFVFVIPVRNPLDQKVENYNIIESLLERTVKSLLRQTHAEINVVVCCHGTPEWTLADDPRVTVLDVSGHQAFRPDQNPVVLDKGLKYTLGCLYSLSELEPDLIMLMDADDYVNVELARRLLGVSTNDRDLDGYIVDKGVHVSLSVGDGDTIHHEFALIVDEFHHTCGSCRVFRAEQLRSRFLELSREILERFFDWSARDKSGTVRVPEGSVRWLWELTKHNWEKEGNLVNLLGRHTRQVGHFNFACVDFLGAAKGCGHGNHDGPRGGTVHWQREVQVLPIREFKAMFGLPAGENGFSEEEIRKAREIDRKAGRIWDDP